MHRQGPVHRGAADEEVPFVVGDRLVDGVRHQAFPCNNFLLVYMKEFFTISLRLRELQLKPLNVIIDSVVFNRFM